MWRMFALLAFLAIAGCGPNAHGLREKTLSVLNSEADRWDGGKDFDTSAADAYGRGVSAIVQKGPVNYTLEVRSTGPDGLPKNNDDIVVTRTKPHGETPVPGELAEGGSHDRTELDPVQVPSIDELLLFFPSKYPVGDWAPMDLRFDDVWFSAADKTRLHGWYCPCDNPRATVLIAHGNAGHVASRAPWLRCLQSRARVATFMFDYRGYGRSEGVPTVEGALLDAAAARTKLRELARIEDSEMLLMGDSLGGAIVVRLAAESAPRGLVLQSTFSSLKDVAEVHYPSLSWLVPSAKLNSVNQIVRYHGPLLHSHGTADGTIPFASGEKLFRAAHEPKTFATITGADHNNWLTEEYLTRLNEFIGGLASERKYKSN